MPHSALAIDWLVPPSPEPGSRESAIASIEQPYPALDADAYRVLFESNPKPTWVVDIESQRFRAANAAATRRFGYSAEEYLDRTLSDVCPMEEVNEIVGGATLLTWRHRTKSGAVPATEVIIRQIDLGGRPAVIIVVSAVTDLRQTLVTLREREELLRNVIAHIPCGVYWKDRASIYLGCNRRVTEDLACRMPGEVIGKTDYEFAVVPAEAAASRATEQQVLATGRPALDAEETYTRPDGSKATRLVSRSPLRDAAGEVVGVLGVYQDITERKRLDEQYRQAQKMEAMGRLAGGVAHDFNNLLTVINGYGQLLLDTLPPDDPSREVIEEIYRSGTRAASLTRQLLAFCRQSIHSPKFLDLNDVVKDIEKMLRRVIGEQFTLAFRPQPRLGAVYADEGEIEQVVLNLVVNARDAMPDGGQVTITTADIALTAADLAGPDALPPGPYVRVTVEDTGTGIPEEVRAQLFEPFFTTKEAGKGTGLGLATVYGVVHRAGGRVGYSTAVGRGTRIWFDLPKVDVPVGGSRLPGEHLADDVPAAARGGETVLLVEDDAAVRELTRRLLAANGYRVLTAADGPTAVRTASTSPHPIDLLMTDVVMPGMNGREVAEQIRHIYPGVKVLYMSGYADDAVVRHGVQSCQVQFLQKPFLSMTLAGMVREVLDNPDPPGSDARPITPTARP